MIGPGGTSVIITPEGGFAKHLINKTGGVSVKGALLTASQTTDFAVEHTAADGDEGMGVIYNSGIADGELVWVVFSGFADLLLQDSTASTHGNWVRTSITTAGRATALLAGPPGGGVTEIDRHFREFGHCFQSVTAGTDKLARCLLHFN